MCFLIANCVSLRNSWHCFKSSTNLISFSGVRNYCKRLGYTVSMFCSALTYIYVICLCSHNTSKYRNVLQIAQTTIEMCWGLTVPTPFCLILFYLFKLLFFLLFIYFYFLIMYNISVHVHKKESIYCWKRKWMYRIYIWELIFVSVSRCVTSDMYLM